MRHVKIGWAGGIVAGLLAAGADASDVFWAGRTLEENRDARVSLQVGSILSMDGFVQETHRALYDVTGHDYKQNPERYDLDDFKVNGGYVVAGLGYESAWKYVTLEGYVLGMNPTTDATARRNYYLSVGSVDFNGQTYDHIKIPEGTPFSAEFFGAMFDINGLATPVTIWMNQTTRFTPWLGLGIYGLGGSYTVDAGTATGTTTYQDPPQDFVVGGHADGEIIAALPELVLGGELEFGEDAEPHFVLQGYYGYFTYSGSAGYFSSAKQKYDRHADIDHSHARLRAAYDYPLKSGRVLTMGGQLEIVNTKATLTHTGDTPEDILAMQQQYDSVSKLDLTTGTLFFGVAF